MFLSMTIALALGLSGQADPDSIEPGKAGTAQLYAECAGYYDFIADSQESSARKQSADIMRNMSRNAVLISRRIYTSDWQLKHPDGKRQAIDWEREAIAPHRKRVKLMLLALDRQDDPSMRDSYGSKCARLTEMTDLLLKSIERQTPGK